MSASPRPQVSMARLAAGTMVWATLCAASVGFRLLGSSVWDELLVIASCAAIAAGVTALFWRSFVTPANRAVIAHGSTEHDLRLALDKSREDTAVVAGVDVDFRTATEEADVLRMLGGAAGQLLDGRDNWLLLSQAATPRVMYGIPITGGAIGDPVEYPDALHCEALSELLSVQTPSSTLPGACQHLSTHDTDVSGACFPIVGEGLTPIGALHSAAAPGDLVDASSTALMDVVCRLAGHRLTAIRSHAELGDGGSLDPLTGLPMHTTISRVMVALSGRGQDYALALCDLDNFGAYASGHGREGADVALRRFAHTLRTTLRPADISGRYVDDKFVCVLPDCSARNAQAVMERIRESFLLGLVEHGTPTITASFGVAEARPGTAPADLVEQADIALLMAKNSGGNRVHCSDLSDAS